MEQNVTTIPVDIWHRVFDFVEPDIRTEFMWTLQLAIPAFKWVFAQTPGLWMHWVFHGDRVSRQSNATKFAINLWLELYEQGDRCGPYVNIHVVDPPFSYIDLIYLLPVASLRFVRSIDFGAEQVALSPLSVSLFLDYFPSLTHVGIDVCDRILGASGLFGPPPSIALFVDAPISDLTPTFDSRGLSSLSLAGASFSVDAPGNIILTNFTSIHLTDQVLSGDRFLPLLALLQQTPNLREFTFRMQWLQAPGFSNFWEIPPNHFLPQYTAALRRLDLAGDIRDSINAINILTDAKSSQLTYIKLVLFCDSADDDPTFWEVTSFNSELVSNTDEVHIEGDVLRIRSRRSPNHSHPVQWSVQWKLVTISQGFWVSVPLRMFT